MKPAVLVAALMAAWLSNSVAIAATATFSATRRTTSPEEVANGAPAGGDVYKYFVTTDADILSISNVQIMSSAPLFQVAPPWGSNIKPPPPEFLALFPSLSADSWITTPGPTHILGSDMPGDGQSLWGDFTNDGPQVHFQFAQLTLPPGATANFTGRIALRGATGPEYFPIVPEPCSWLLAGIGATALAACRRRRLAS